MTGTNCDLFTHNQSRSYLNHLVQGLQWFKNDVRFECQHSKSIPTDEFVSCAQKGNKTTALIFITQGTGHRTNYSTHFYYTGYWTQNKLQRFVLLATFWKATVSFFMFAVCPSVHLSLCPHGTNRLPLDKFLWNLIFELFLETLWRKLKFP